MKTTKKIFYIAIYVFLLFCIINSIYLSIYEDKLIEEHINEQHEELKSLVLNDVVESKFIDIENHSFRIIIFKNNKKFNIINSDTLGFFNYIENKDSIVKDKGSDTIKVFRNGILNKFKLERGFIE